MYTEGYFDDRVCKDVKPIPIKPLDNSILFREGKPNWKLVKEHLKHQGKIAREDILTILADVMDIFKEEKNICMLKDPVVIVGDLHGQYQDLVKVLQLGGDPASNNQLFMGDQVDRGPFALEVVILLFCMKINQKSSLVMLRGNHESRTMTGNFDFKRQVEYQYDAELQDKFMECFDTLPLGCLLDKFLVVHGGISPDMTLDKIMKLNRFTEPPKEGLLCDILWADPIDEKNDEGKKGTQIENNKPKDIETWAANDMRGCSQYQGKTVARRFLEEHKLYSLIRAHEAQQDGFKFNQFQLQNNNKVFPQVITIFSAPNQCGYQGNQGAIMKLKGTDIKIEKQGESKKPQVLPNVMDVFDWSIPFLTENITAVLKIILGGSDNKLSRTENSRFKADVLDARDTDFNRTKIIQIKIRFLGRLSNMFKRIKKNGLEVGNERAERVTIKKDEKADEETTGQNVFLEMSKSDMMNEGFPTAK